MRLKNVLVLTKILPLLLLLTQSAWAEDTNRIFDCMGALAAARAKAEPPPPVIIKPPYEDESELRSKLFKSPEDFERIDERVEQLRQNPDQITNETKKLSLKIVNGDYEISELVAIAMRLSPRVAKAIKSLRGKGGFRITRKRFRYFGIFRNRAYAARVGIKTRYVIYIPKDLLKNSKNPAQDFNEFMISFADALEKTAGRNNNFIVYPVKSLVRTLSAFSLAGMDFYRNALSHAVLPYSIAKDEGAPVFSNLATRLYTDDAERKKMLLDLLETLKDPDRVFTHPLALDVSEDAILNEKGLDALVNQIIVRRGIQEGIHFVARASILLLGYYIQSNDILGKAGKGFDHNGLNHPHDFCHEDKKNRGFVSLTESVDDKHILVDNPTSYKPPSPFDPYFIDPPEEPKLQNKPNPCDPHGNLANGYHAAYLEVKENQKTNPNYRLSDWLRENSGLRDSDNGTLPRENYKKTDILIEELRKNYQDLSTGCCYHYAWSYEKDAKTTPDSSQEILSNHQ